MSDNRMIVRARDTGEAILYKDGEPVPYPVYRCHKADERPSKVIPYLDNGAHKCKRVTDHPGPCRCICGKEFTYV